MSKIIVSGSAIVLKSDATLENIQKLLKYRPAALELRGEKDELLYKVGVAGDGNGSVTPKALYFAPKTFDAEKLATITMEIPGTVTNVKDYVADLLGTAYEQLTKIEANIAKAVTDVDKFKADMMERITLQ